MKSKVCEDFKFKISEGYEQNWSFPVPALFRLDAGGPQAKQGRDWKSSFLLVAFWIFWLRVFKYRTRVTITRSWLETALEY